MFEKTNSDLYLRRCVSLYIHSEDVNMAGSRSRRLVCVSHRAPGSEV